MLNKIVETGETSFLNGVNSTSSAKKTAILKRALAFVDSLPTGQHTMFDSMSKAEIKFHRASRKL